MLYHINQLCNWLQGREIQKTLLQKLQSTLLQWTFIQNIAAPILRHSYLKYLIIWSCVLRPNSVELERSFEFLASIPSLQLYYPFHMTNLLWKPLLHPILSQKMSKQGNQRKNQVREKNAHHTSKLPRPGHSRFPPSPLILSHLYPNWFLALKWYWTTKATKLSDLIFLSRFNIISSGNEIIVY